MNKLMQHWNETLLPWLTSHGLRILLITVGAWILSKVLKKFIDKAVRIAIVADPDHPIGMEKQREDTIIEIFSATLVVALFACAAMMILAELGVMIGPLLAGAGIVGLAFGFGGQYLIRDIITGLFIILESQYRIGDSITVDKVSGTVEKISLRKTTLRDMDGTVHHIPHGEIKVVSNKSKLFSRINLDLGVGYNADLSKVIAVINETGKTLASDPAFAEIITIAPAFLRVQDLADSAVIVKVTGETMPGKQWMITGEFRLRIKQAFDKAGIEIPFPQMVVHQAKRNDPEPAA
ncbi:MAG: mechanosensitive ion channel family protein [Chitinophagaceae bacterium]